MDNQKNIDAFNKGYELSKLDKTLTSSLLKSIDQNSPESMQYFRAGAMEREKELMRDRLTERKIDRSRDRGLDR